MLIAVLAVALLVGIVSAATISYFGQVKMTATVNQAVLLDGKDINSMPINETATVAGGESFCRYHYLTSQTSVPVALKFHTDYSPEGGGITVTYSTAILQQSGTGVAGWSTEQVHKGTYSVKLTTVTTDDYSRAYITGEGKTLADIGSVSYWSYVTSANNSYVRPWVGIYLDTNPTHNTLEQWFTDWHANNNTAFYIQAEPCYTDGYSDGFNVWQYWDSEGAHPLKWEGLESPDDPYKAPTLKDYINGNAMNYSGEAFASREYGTLTVVGIKFMSGYGGTWANFAGFVDDVMIGGKTHDLELFPEDTPFTLQPSERLDFYICYKFDLLIKAGTYDIYTTVKPSP
jgi:hypothetical protein